MDVDATRGSVPARPGALEPAFDYTTVFGLSITSFISWFDYWNRRADQLKTGTEFCGHGPARSQSNVWTDSSDTGTDEKAMQKPCFDRFLRLQNDLDAVVLLLVERLVQLRPVLE